MSKKWLLNRLLQEEDHEVDHEGEEHGDEHGEESEGIDVKTFQIILIFCMIICVGFGLIPKAWGKCRDDQYVLSFLNCFSAGIFLAMALVHMMPEAQEVYLIWAAKEGIERPFPLPFVMFFVGYLFILGIDRVAARAYHSGHDHAQKAGPLKPEDIVPSQVEMSAKVNTVYPDRSVTLATEAQKIVETELADEKVVEIENGKEGKSVSKTAAIILVLALGAHAFFEGIAFGLQTTIGSAGQLAAGILIHKTAAAISLGGAFANTGYAFKEIALFLGIFSLIAPLGIIIGMSISESNKLVDVVFLSISGGTFIYVACSEIIVAEFDKGKYQWAKMLLVILGGIIITCLWFFGEHSHAEEGGHDDHDDH